MGNLKFLIKKKPPLLEVLLNPLSSSFESQLNQFLDSSFGPQERGVVVSEEVNQVFPNEIEFTSLSVVDSSHSEDAAIDSIHSQVKMGRILIVVVVSGSLENLVEGFQDFTIGFEVSVFVDAQHLIFLQLSSGLITLCIIRDNPRFVNG